MLKNQVWSLARETAAVSTFVLAHEEGEADASPPGTKETGEVFGAKHLYKEKGSNQTHWWSQLLPRLLLQQSGWNPHPTPCSAVTVAANQLHRL